MMMMRTENQKMDEDTIDAGSTVATQPWETRILTDMGINPHIVERGSLKIEFIGNQAIVRWKGVGVYGEDELRALLAEGEK